jgi:hypothetical protein
MVQQTGKLFINTEIYEDDELHEIDFKLLSVHNILYSNPNNSNLKVI